MSGYFHYDVSPEVRSSCLEMIERAAERVARGEPAFVGNRNRPDRRLGRSTRKRNAVKTTLRNRVFELRDQGLSREQIAAEMRASLNRVDYILYIQRRTAR